MSEYYVIALVNLALSLAAHVICICRLNAMQPGVRWIVRAEYAFGAAALLVSAFRPLIGEWPGYASLGVAAYVLWALIASSAAWHGDRAPESATDNAPLEMKR